MVGSNVMMEHAASTPSLVLLQQLMDSGEGSAPGTPIPAYPCSRKRSSLPPGVTPPSPQGSRWPQNLLQDLLRSSRRGRKGSAERKGPPERKGSPDPLQPMARRIWCDSEECLSSGPFIRIQAFAPNGQCVNCGRTMKDAATNTECSKESVNSSGESRVSRENDEAELDEISSKFENSLNEDLESLADSRVSDGQVPDSARYSKRKSLPGALDWWSDKVMRRQSSNLKDNVRKSLYSEETNKENGVSSRTEKLSVSDQSLNQIDAIIPSQRVHSNSNDSMNPVDTNKTLISSMSTPNLLSYPSTQVHKSHSARLAGWWEESPFPVRSQRFTFRSHSSGHKVVLRKGHSAFEVSAQGSRRHSTNFADLEELMGAVSGSEEETEPDEDDRSPVTMLLPYQALEEEMDSFVGNVNQSNSVHSSSLLNTDARSSFAPRSRSVGSNLASRPKSIHVDFIEPSDGSQSAFLSDSLPKSAAILSQSTPHINTSGPASFADWSYQSPSLENVIQTQFLRNTSLASLHCQKHHQSSNNVPSGNVLPGNGPRTPKRLQSATRTGTKRRRDAVRHSWAGNPNPLSTSVLKLAQSAAGERLSWIGIIDDLPVILEDRGREKKRDGRQTSGRERDGAEDGRRERESDGAKGFLQPGDLVDAIFGSTQMQYLKATSALGSQEPRLDPDDEDGFDHPGTVDPSSQQLLGSKGDVRLDRKRPKGRTKPPFQRRVSPPAASFNPWVLQPQQLRQRLECLQQEPGVPGSKGQGGVSGSRGLFLQNSGTRLTRPELIIVDIFDDSHETCRVDPVKESCHREASRKGSCGDLSLAVCQRDFRIEHRKMPQENAMEDPVSMNNSNMEVSVDSLKELEAEEASKNSRGSSPAFVRSVSNIISHEREVFVDSPDGGATRNGGRSQKHTRTTNNNRRSLSPQAREFAAKVNNNGAIGNRRSQNLPPDGATGERTNGYRERKKSLALAMNEGRLEMKEVRMRPLDIETDFHLIVQLNQLNQELMDLSKSGSGSSPSSPGVTSPLERNHDNHNDAGERRTSGGCLSPVPESKHSNGLDANSATPIKKERTHLDSRHRKLNMDGPRRHHSDEPSSPVSPTPNKKQSPELKALMETTKESKSNSPREMLSRIKLRLSNSKFSRNSPQRSSAGKVEIEILRPNVESTTPESDDSPFRRSASLKHDSEVRRTWPNMEANAESSNDSSVRNSVSGQSPNFPRNNSDGPLERHRKKPALPDDSVHYLNALEQSQNAPGSSTDSGLCKDHRCSKSSADSLLEDFHIITPESSQTNSNPPSRPISSDLGDFSWERGQEVTQGQLGRDLRYHRYISKSVPPTPALLTPTEGSREDLVDQPMSMPGSQEDLLGGRGNRMRASGDSHGSSISHAALQSGVKPPKPRHRPTRRSKTDLGDPKIIKAALLLAKMQGDETPKVVQRSRPSSARKKRPTSALGTVGTTNSASGRESPVRQLTQAEGKVSPVAKRVNSVPDKVPLVIDIDVIPPTSPELPPMSPKRRSHSLGELGVVDIPSSGLMKKALSLPSGLGDEEEMLSDPDLSRINARMSETFEQFCAATLAEALFDHVTMESNELTFQAGDMVEITDMADTYWWWGCIDKQEGWLPAPFVRLKVSQGETVEECISRLSQDNTMVTQKGLKPSRKPLMRKVSLSFLSNDQVRANIIREIITTERDYVKNLADICEGYIEQARSRPDMFSDTLMTKLFCNIEEIYNFQQRFLMDLETCIDDDMPHVSAIGECFLRHKTTFDIYGEYCNNYPHAVSQLQELLKDNKFVQFFEACRLLQAMIQISLDGFLLTPVQKICKYPLQLNELLKYTRPQHDDCQPLKSALDGMREVAQSINERKRRIEHIENIATWQKNIGDWEGDDVLDRSSMLIYSDEVNRVSLTGRHRTSPRQLFLFDHQLIICRKDILRRDVLLYKDRIDLDDCQIEDLPDGKENEWSVTLRYAWKIQNFEDPARVYVFMCRSRKEKKRWLRHFAKERKIVHEGLTRVRQGSLHKSRSRRKFKSSSFIAAKEAALQSATGTIKPSKPNDRVVTVRRALSMPGRKVREQASSKEGLQLPRATSTDNEPDTPKRKGRSLFGFQVGKK